MRASHGSFLIPKTTHAKGKFKDIVEKREALMKQQRQMEEESFKGKLDQAIQIIEQQKQIIAQYEGGGQSEMPQM